MSQQLLALFIQADHGLLGIVGFGVKVQQGIHPFPIFDGDSRHAPHHFSPGLENVFFRIRRMVSRLIPLRTSWFWACSMSNLIVQRLAPAGAGVHAKAVSSAATLGP